MKSIITNTWIIICLCISTLTYAQNDQSNFINYQGLATDSNGEIIAEQDLNLQISILLGAPDAPASYVENHTVTTDTNGVFAIQIGDGSVVSGDYTTLNFNDLAPYLKTTLNGEELGVTEMLAVPYAINAQSSKVATDMELDELTNVSGAAASGQVLKYDGTNWTAQSDETGIDTQWITSGNNISYSAGNVGINRDPTTTLDINGDLRLENGVSANEISTDTTLGSNSNQALPTERAIKTYVDNATATETPIIFKVRGNGFAVKDLDGGTTVETDIWDIETYDTRNAFNTTTKRYVVPESGYYYLHAVVRQSNTVTNAFFRIHFNVDTGINYNQIVDGDDVKINVSGIYFLNAGQQVFVNLRNFSSGTDVRIDGTGSWFEGYKIN